MSGGLRHDLHGPPWVDLTVAILRAAPPKLTAPRCVGKASLFDGDGPDGPRTRRAIELCRQCPALSTCRAWLRSVSPTYRPSGICAGTYRSGRRKPHK